MARKENIVSLIMLAMAVLMLSAPAAAQDDAMPPPVTIVSRADRERLDAKTDLKDRTRLALDMMGERLVAAERSQSAEDFDAVYRELGYFHGLVDDSLEVLQRKVATGGKVLDNLKRLEMGLRAFMPRLESIRREVPSKYEEYISKLMRVVRDARAKATEPMFSDNVVPQSKRPIDQL